MVREVGLKVAVRGKVRAGVRARVRAGVRAGVRSGARGRLRVSAVVVEGKVPCVRRRGGWMVVGMRGCGGHVRGKRALERGRGTGAGGVVMGWRQRVGRALSLRSSGELVGARECSMISIFTRFQVRGLGL